MPRLFMAFKAALLALFMVAAAPSQAADDVIKTVYHLSEGIPQASRAVNNIRNHLAADPRPRSSW